MAFLRWSRDVLVAMLKLSVFWLPLIFVFAWLVD